MIKVGDEASCTCYGLGSCPVIVGVWSEGVMG